MRKADARQTDAGRNCSSDCFQLAKVEATGADATEDQEFFEALQDQHRPLSCSGRKNSPACMLLVMLVGVICLAIYMFGGSPKLRSTLGGQYSLFCFTLVQSDSYEVSLVSHQHQRGVGLFSCDEYAVFSDRRLPLTGEPLVYTEVIQGPLRVPKSDPPYNFALNTEVFFRVWEKVWQDRTYANHDWIVKVDPDTVFLPNRLRQHLSHGPPPTASISFINCYRGLHGPIEIMSRPAVDRYRDGLDRCRIDLASYVDVSGEDMFMSRCLTLLQIQQVDDFNLLSEKACGEEPSPCTSGKTAFHPFKAPELYFQCLVEAER